MLIVSHLVLIFSTAIRTTRKVIWVDDILAAFTGCGVVFTLVILLKMGSFALLISYVFRLIFQLVVVVPNLRSQPHLLGFVCLSFTQLYAPSMSRKRCGMYFLQKNDNVCMY